MGGGCPEGDALRRGEHRTRDGAPAVVAYDAADDDGAPGGGVGPGCDGVVEA